MQERFIIYLDGGYGWQEPYSLSSVHHITEFKKSKNETQLYFYIFFVAIYLAQSGKIYQGVFFRRLPSKKSIFRELISFQS